MAIAIPKITAQATSDEYTTAGNNTLGFTCIGLGTGETVKLQVKDEFTNTFADALIDNVVPQMDSRNNMMTIYADARIYRVIKSATINPVGVIVNQTTR